MTGNPLQQPFEVIYASNAWSHGSGPGSRSVNTIEYRAFVERFMAANAVRTVTDLGCGDWQFSRQIDWSAVHYIGLDVVPALITTNRARFSRPNIEFRQLREIDDLPGGDLCLGKEVLQHLPTRMVMDYVAAIRRKYKFALLTNSIDPPSLANSDIAPGGYRPLRLDEPPFNVPGARVLTYFPEADNFVFKNVVFLVMGAEATT